MLEVLVVKFAIALPVRLGDKKNMPAPNPVRVIIEESFFSKDSFFGKILFGSFDKD